MKNAFIAFLIMISQTAVGQTGAVTSGSIETLDTRYGFLGNKFDTPLSQFKGLIFIENRGGEKVFKKAPNKKLGARASIKYVKYYFYKDRLSSVQVIASNSLENEESWLELLHAAYGPAQDTVVNKNSDEIESGNYGSVYLWGGKRARINFSSYLGRDISIYVGSTDISLRQKADSQKALKQAASRL